MSLKANNKTVRNTKREENNAIKMLPHLEKVSEALQVFNLIVNRLLPPPHQQLNNQTRIKPRPAKPGCGSGSIFTWECFWVSNPHFECGSETKWLKMTSILKTGGFIFRFFYVLNSILLHLLPLRFHCAGIEPRTVASLELAVGRCNHSAKSHQHSPRSHMLKTV
jgi:hypothetical protein